MSDDRFVNNAYDNIKNWTSGLEKSSGIAFDIGANVGLYSLMLAHLWPDCVVYAFEPVKSNFDVLVKHIQINKLEQRINAFNFGFWSKDTQMSLWIPKNRDKGNTGLYSSFHPDGSRVTQGQFHVLDMWCNEKDIWPDFIKVDTEGAEFEILSTSLVCLSKVKRIITEYNVKDNDFPNPENLSLFLINQGFTGDRLPGHDDDIIWIK